MGKDFARITRGGSTSLAVGLPCFVVSVALPASVPCQL
jgi:hypothetical protein